MAMSLAIQLPSEADEARAVVDDVADLLERFMTRSPRAVWDRQPITQLPPASSLPAGAFWMAVVLSSATLVAVAAGQLVGVRVAGALVLSTAVMMLGVVFGRMFGLAAALAAMLLTNLLMAPPVMQLTVPDAVELVFYVGYLVSGLAVPIVACHAAALRAGAAIACARPGRASEAPLPD
jgi:K+-sensing histidine kinase KdpD